MSNQMGNLPHSMHKTVHHPPYKLVSPQLMRMLMDRTGTGDKVSIRDLAEDVGLPRTTISNLLTGAQATIPDSKALRITQRLGVDLLVLFTPAQRSASPIGDAPPERASFASRAA